MPAATLLSCPLGESTQLSSPPRGAVLHSRQDLAHQHVSALTTAVSQEAAAEVQAGRRESKKRSWSHARQARKQEGFHQGSCKHNTDKRTEIVLSPGPQFAALRSSETESSENGALRPTEAVNGGGAPLGLQPPPTPGHDVLRRGTWGEAQREERALPPP